ncbi:helix-turn-helix domain-containing protein [Streptomyces sp. DH12]|uniref:helix-turn-helix domain-containing protein n=1 Tax=Streptomyces sp. DH12 TaxID=2857010 RepID=UPI001E28ECE4|nr:helix-turn-helix domain-containing protein [Streptomyces sp. DH12]
MDTEYIPPGYYGTHDVARALGTSPGGVRNLVYRGRLKRAGGTERHPWYRAEDVAAVLAQRQARATA